MSPRSRSIISWAAAPLLAVGVLVPVVATAGPAGAAGATVTSVPRPDHIVIVVEENHSAPGIMGNPDAPFINSLAGTGANLTQSFAETHPSQPNYIALFSGGTQGVTDDTCPHTISAANLGGELLTAGLGFVGYSEGLPSVGYTGCASGKYARKHSPWTNFTDIPSAANQPFSAFPSDYSTLPAVSFVIPDLNNDMHDGTIAQGDQWLQNNLGGYISWAQTHNSVFLLTFDEDDHGANNQIPTVITGGPILTGTYPELVNHYNVLRTIQDAYGLAPTGASATASPILDIWNPPTGPQPPTAAFTSSCVQLACTFDGSSSTDSDGTIASYAWTFGDGATASGATPSHTFAAAGSYSVSLTVTDNDATTGTVSHSVAVSGVLAQDTFGRSVTNGWGSADVGGPWSLTGAATQYSVAGGVGRVRLAAPSAGPTAALAGVSAANVNLLVDTSVDKIGTGDGTYVILITRRTAAGDYRMKLRLLPAGVLHLAASKVVSGRESTLREIIVKNLTYAPGDVLRVRLQVLGAGASTTLSGSVWTVGTAEPASPQISFVDAEAALQNAGTIAIQTSLGSTATNAPVTVSYDNLSIAPLGGNAPPTASFTSSCSQLSCTVDGSASADTDGSVSSYAWQFGDGSVGSGPTLTHAYIAAGSYPVTLTVTDNQGATGVVQHTVVATAPPLNQPPTARFTSSCTALACAFDGSTSSDPEDALPEDWAWDFGDNTTSTATSPNHTYAAAGTYQVTLTVTDEDDATDTVTHSVTVSAGPPPNQPPTARFTSSCSALACAFDGSTSSDSDGSIVLYSWAFGDGTTGTGPTPGHSYTAATTYLVELTVTDDDGSTDVITHSVTTTNPVDPSIATDAFGRTVTNAWGSADLGGAWSLTGASSQFSVGSGVGRVRLSAPAAGPTASLTSVSAADVNVLVDTSVDKIGTGDGVYVILMTRRTAAGDYRLKLRLLPAGVLHLALSKVVAGRETTLREIIVTGLSYGAGDVLRLRFRVSGSAGSTLLRGTVWKVAATEPASPQISFTDSESTLQGAGAFAIQTSLASTATNAPVTVSYDNLSITAA